jgi:hypothetical protein
MNIRNSINSKSIRNLNIEQPKPETELKSSVNQPSVEQTDESQLKESQVKTYLDVDANSGSEVTWMTETSSIFKNPSSLAGVSSAQLEIQLNYLAKELELERLRREKLQKQVEEMQENLNR